MLNKFVGIYILPPLSYDSYIFFDQRPHTRFYIKLKSVLTFGRNQWGYQQHERYLVARITNSRALYKQQKDRKTSTPQYSQIKPHAERELANFEVHHRDNYENTREIT